MSRRGVFILCAPLLVAASSPPAPPPLQPIKPWVVNYDTAECTAQRSYGDPANPSVLVIGPSAWGDNYELMIVREGQGPKYAEELQGSVDFGTGPIKAWLLRWGGKTPKPREYIKFRINGAQMAEAHSADAVSFHIDGRRDIAFSLAAVPALFDTLKDCTVDLQHYWNMIDPEQKKIAAPPVGDIRSIFTSDDYPDEAMAHNQEGKAQFQLFIDEKGKVAACYVLEPSGIPALDGLGCQVIRKRATFKPAIDTAGKPIRSAYVPPPVQWRFEY